jgi:hypothetical protein
LFIVFPLLFAACTLINDDLSVCGEELVVDYQVQLHTDLNMQLQADLSLEAEAQVRSSIEDWLKPVFTDKAHDVDLRFYSTENDEQKYRINEEINDNRSSYIIHLPHHNYVHLALANIMDNNELRLLNGEHSETMELRLKNSMLASSLNTGVFTARLPMEVNDTTTHFEVHLSMMVAAVVLVVDTTRCAALHSLNATMKGSATGFSVRDSIYYYDASPVFVMEHIAMKDDSPSAPASRRTACSEPANPYRCTGLVCLPTEEGKTWSVDAVATLQDNKHTTTTLTIDDPLLAGSLRVLSVRMDSTGALRPKEGQQVGVSVQLDWKEGGEHEIDL